MPSLLLLYDVTKERISYASGAVTPMFGYGPDEIAAVELPSLLHPGDASRFAGSLGRVASMPDRSIVITEVRWRHADGDWRWTSAAATAFSRADDGRLLETLLVCQDITERKVAQDAVLQSQKMEAIGTLAGGIAHDFNNILSVVLGNAQMARADVQPGTPAYRNLGDVLLAGNRATALVDQILAFSRKGVAEQGVLRLGTVVDESLRFMRATLPASVQIRKEIDPERDFVRGDTTELHQVVMNLCLNAAHAMREKGGSLNVRMVPVDLQTEEAPGLAPGPYTRLTVQDTGPGVDREIAGRIFEPFFTTKRPEQGTGLGLFVTHQIVTAHGGAITLEPNQTGRGATFHVYLPRTEAGPAADHEAASELPRGTERVLVVDDEEAIVTVSRLMLETLGYEVVGCKSAAEALERFRTSPEAFDLVISDAIMPGMSGVALAKKILGIRPNVAIILGTGFTDRLLEKEAMAAGLRGYLRKPILIEHLARSVRQALNEANKPAESAHGTYSCHR